MGAPSITYESPKIEKDNTFRDYLQYQQDRQLDLDTRSQEASDRTDAATRRRREQGALGFQGFAENLQKNTKNDEYSDEEDEEEIVNSESGKMKKIEKENVDLSKFQSLLKLYDRADILNDIV